MPRTIGFIGSLSLLVSGLTGPSLAVIPLLYQQAGWLTPFIAFAVIAFLTGSGALFVIEAMSSIEGNEEFQASIEFTTIAHLFLGKRWHWAVQVVLYIALQSLIISSLLESFQSMDSLLISVAHKTCAISFQRGWICADQMLSNGTGVFSDYILASLGTLISLVLILPLSLIQLTDNIKYQVASFILLLAITGIWLGTFIQVGLHNITIPVVTSNQSTVVGFVLSNFAFVTTIPAWINNTHPSVNIRLVVWLSLAISCAIYIPIGWMGASAFDIQNNATILNILTANRPNIVAIVSTYIFPVAVLITSVPVFAIVVRYNLLRGNICSKPMAIFLSSILPWILAIPFQTKGWLAIILNWASLIFSSPANLIVPFLLYLVSKRYRASALLDATIDDSSGSSVATHSSTEGVHLRTIRTLDDSRASTNSPVPTVVVISDETNLKSEDETYIRLVRSPSVHRYYGQNSRNSMSGPSSSGSRQKSLELDGSYLAPVDPYLAPGDPTSPSSPRPSIAGTDEFRLSEPLPTVSLAVASVGDQYFSETPKDPENQVIIIEVIPTDPAPAFEVFPFLRPTSWCRPSRVAVVECVFTVLLVLSAFAYNIVESVKGNTS